MWQVIGRLSKRDKLAPRTCGEQEDTFILPNMLWHNNGITLGSLQRIWRVAPQPEVVAVIAGWLGVSEEEARALLAG